jgi:hypothetical protein
MTTDQEVWGSNPYGCATFFFRAKENRTGGMRIGGSSRSELRERRPAARSKANPSDKSKSSPVVAPNRDISASTLKIRIRKDGPYFNRADSPST